jgi:two-component system OmpR family sensor kinase
VARLLADLRRLADVETRIIEYARVDLDALIHQAVEDASTAPGAEDRMIVATVARAPWRLPDVAGEEDLLLTAILNLLGNALKYSSQAEVVELRANEQIIDGHRWVVVEVADTGSGIPLAEQEAVWDELSRGSRVRAVAGSGMGLSLVRAIVTRHGGSVQLFSQEGVGTSVRMVLPVLADAAPVTVPQISDHMDRVAAGSRAVQPVQQADSRQGPGFLPPRQPNEAELQGRILGTPRRTSKRRLERVDGALVNRTTGESVSGGLPPDSGQHSQFKPPQGGPRAGPGLEPPRAQGRLGRMPGRGPAGRTPGRGPAAVRTRSSARRGQQNRRSQPNSGPQQPYPGRPEQGRSSQARRRGTRTAAHQGDGQ